LSIQGISADQDRLAVYAAQRASDGALTIVAINKTGEALTSSVAISHFTPAAIAQVYRYSAANLDDILRQPDQAGAGGISASLGPSSSCS
jgi:hypothetical protein